MTFLHSEKDAAVAVVVNRVGLNNHDSSAEGGLLKQHEAQQHDTKLHRQHLQ